METFLFVVICKSKKLKSSETAGFEWEGISGHLCVVWKSLVIFWPGMKSCVAKVLVASPVASAQLSVLQTLSTRLSISVRISDYVPGSHQFTAVR